MIFLTILKYSMLMLAIMYTFSNVVKAFHKMSISSYQLAFMAGSIVFYLILQFEIGA